MMKLLIYLFTVFSIINGDVDLENFLKDYNQFSASLYQEARKTQSGNIIVSPLSAEIILALTQSGAVGATGEEIRSTLHLPGKEETTNIFKELIPKLKSGKHYILRSANKIYVKEGFILKPGFEKTAVEVYDAGVQNVDFEKSAETARTINNWVENKTENKIQDLVDPKSFTKLTRAILVNALYFKGEWEGIFKAQETSKKEFYKNETVVEVDTMKSTASFDYFECPHVNAKFLKLPYGNDDATLTIVLPNERNGLSELENQGEYIFGKHNFTKEYVQVSLPKFKIEQKTELTGILQNLGILKAFNDNQADFSEIAEINNDRLVITEVVQKAFIEVNEKGAEAAAATEVQMSLTRAGTFTVPLFIQPKLFIADHPFVFYIKVKDVVVFVGRLTSP